MAISEGTRPTGALHFAVQASWGCNKPPGFGSGKRKAHSCPVARPMPTTRVKHILLLQMTVGQDHFGCSVERHDQEVMKADYARKDENNHHISPARRSRHTQGYSARISLGVLGQFEGVHSVCVAIYGMKLHDLRV